VKADWSYSNTNYIALGLLIEAVTGRRYADEVRARILEPLGLTRTQVPGDEVDLPNPHLHAYLESDDELVDCARMNPSQAWAAGQVVSTADDLSRFYAAVLGGELLGADELAAMLTVVPSGDGTAYGLGIEQRTLPGGLVVWGHTGGIFGYFTLSYHSAVRCSLSCSGQRAEATASRNQPVCGIHCSAQRQLSPSGASSGRKAMSFSSVQPEVMPLTMPPGRFGKSEE
jgi:hypothetical protein